MELKHPWSYSALTAYETCPKRYQLTRVTKQVVEPQNEATKWGNEVHKALELFAKGQKPLPKSLEDYGKYVRKIQNIEGKRVVEDSQEMRDNLRPVFTTLCNQKEWNNLEYNDDEFQSKWDNMKFMVNHTARGPEAAWTTLKALKFT